MAVAKCMLKLSEASTLCNTLISKEFHVMVTLIDEEIGLRVSDIHFILGGNKSWVSNLCSKLAMARLASSKREGREVYYKLTKKGNIVAIRALNLIESLIKTGEMDYILSSNTYILDPSHISGKSPYQELRKIRYPLYTHKGAIIFNKTEGYVFFVGNDRKGRPLIIEFPLKELQQIEHKFDNYYKRRYYPRPKPLIIEYIRVAEDEPSLYTIYLFINYHIMGRTTNNSKWFDILNEEFTKIQKIKEKSPRMEPEISTIR